MGDILQSGIPCCRGCGYELKAAFTIVFFFNALILLKVVRFLDIVWIGGSKRLMSFFLN